MAPTALLARTIARFVFAAPVLPPLLFLGGCAPAHATPLPAVDAALVLPWGDAVLALVQGVTALLTPVLVAALAAALARFGGPLRLLITDALVGAQRHRLRPERGGRCRPRAQTDRFRRFGGDRAGGAACSTTQ